MMRYLHYTLAVALTAVLLLTSLPSVQACGPDFSDPIYVSRQSPDPPFEEFTNGKIGIVRPSFGRKTLFISYRYLNGGSFTAEDQEDLVAALNGKAPEEESAPALKAWIEARKEFLKEDQKLPEIYTDRVYGSYDFFPNCARNAFEVALQTLKDRTASYGADDKNVREWVAAQDIVFANCSMGAHIPAELGAESVTWLRKDRDYQIAAANFYSLKFDEARARFEKIATDPESPWQEIAGYLVARTLIRQGSLGEDEKKKRELFEQAESHLQTLAMGGGRYADASKKLLALVKYQIHPEERVLELSRILTAGSTDDLRQDLIDYVWLLDKFEERIRKAEEDRKKKEEGQEPEVHCNVESSPEAKEKIERFVRGETVEISVYEEINETNRNRLPVGTTIEFKHDVSETEMIQAFEQKLGRSLTDREKKYIKQTREYALNSRRWRLSSNRKFDFSGLSKYEGCYFDCTKLIFDTLPAFLRSEDLSDWILTTQSQDPLAYRHAFSQWKKTSSPAWLVTALVKADKSSPGLARLMQAAERIRRDDPAFASVAYHLIRLKAAMGQTDEARKLLDEIISWQSGVLPISAQNQFLEQRMNLARDLNEFLKAAQRKPAVFYGHGTFGKLRDLLNVEKSFSSVDDTDEEKEVYARELEESYKPFWPWEDRFGFDYSTLDVFDWHFSLQLLAEAARSPNVPDYLQRSLVLAVWTRAILLNNDEIALRFALELAKVEPQMETAMQSYLNAKTPKERSTAALYVLLQFPKLSPYVQGGLPKFETTEDIEYYFADSWWCKPSLTDYSNEGIEVPKVVPKPSFLNDTQLETARREHDALVAIGDGKSFLGKHVLEWARSSPNDPRIPEALFIATKANKSYKYGCNSWEHDQKVMTETETLLRERYPESPWTAKLSQPEN